MSRLVVISNRLIDPAAKEKGASGGLATALHAALRAYKGIWFGWSGRVVEQSDHQISVADFEGVKIATLDLDQNDFEEYYNGYANSTLWPLFHYRIDLTAYDRAFDTGYHRVNSKFAHTVAPLIEPDDLVWVHDYHLIPVAQQLRDLGLKNRMGFFLHIPWPARQLMITLPKHRKLVEAMFSYDLIGFQTQDHVEAFRDYVIHETDGKLLDKKGRMQCFGRTTQVSAFPIGADTDDLVKMAASREGSAMLSRMRKSLNKRKLIIGVDRLDYSKGLDTRFDAYQAMLEKFEEHRKNVLMLQIAPPSRTDVQEYQDLRDDLESITGRINGRFADVDWVPLRYVNKGYRRVELTGLFRAAAVGFVTPMRDGMNLVAKEFVAAQDPEDPGVLILSRFAGAADQLKSALIVNPYDQDDMVNALHRALTMPLEKRQERWQRLFDNVKKNDVVAWRDTYVDTLSKIEPQAE